MSRSHSIRFGSAAILFALILALPTAALAQSTIDLVVHYVEGIPAESEVAYDVNVFLSVVDSAGNPVKDLTPDSLTVTEDSQKVEVLDLELAKDKPINIVLVLDTSGSMSGPGISAAQTAASNFVSQLGNSDRVAVVTFDNNVKTQIDFTTDHAAVSNQISLIEAVRGAGTCLYDAAYQAIQMSSTLPSGQRAVVLFTDGVDETATGGVCSTHTSEDVIDIASQGGTRTPIYTLGLGGRIDANSLKRLAEFTGGRHLDSPDSSQLDSIFVRLSDQLRSQYLLTYRSVGGPGAHTLAVSVNYLAAQDSDTRNFLLPVLPTRIIFSSPQEGEDVNGILKVAVSLSGQGETVDRVAFEINGDVVGADDTTPYELDIDINKYSIGSLTLSAIAYGSNNVELAKKSISLRVIAPTASTAVPIPSSTPVTNTPAMVAGSIFGGLILVAIVVVAFIFYRRRQEKRRDQAWAKSQSNEEMVAGRSGEDRTVDSWEIGSDALGLVVVLASDDPTMIGHRFEITASVTTLGRSAENDISFPKDSPVSRRHAEISQKKAGLYLREVESTDSSGILKAPTFGTFLNEASIGSDSILLQNDDEIRLGKRVRLRFETAANISDNESITYDGLIASDDPDRTQDQF